MQNLDDIKLKQSSMFYVTYIHCSCTVVRQYDMLYKILFDIPNTLGGHKLSDVLNSRKIGGGARAPLALITRRPC